MVGRMKTKAEREIGLLSWLTEYGERKKKGSSDRNRQRKKE